MACDSPCKEIVLKCCPDEIMLEAGLDANTKYIWSLEDKVLGNTYEGNSTTDAESVLVIDTENLPEGLLNSEAGPFILTLKKDDEEKTPAKLRFSSKDYDCGLISFKNIISANGSEAPDGAPDDHNEIE